MLPIFSFMLGASDVSLFGIMLPLHEVTMFLINRLPGATALLIHTYTNTEVPMLLMFLFGYLAQTSSFLFLLFPLFSLFSLISSFPSPPAFSFFHLPHSLSLTVSFYIQTSSEGYQSLETRIKGKRKCLQNIQNNHNSYKNACDAVPQTVLSYAT